MALHDLRTAPLVAANVHAPVARSRDFPGCKAWSAHPLPTGEGARRAGEGAGTAMRNRGKRTRASPGASPLPESRNAISGGDNPDRSPVSGGVRVRLRRPLRPVEKPWTAKRSERCSTHDNSNFGLQETRRESQDFSRRVAFESVALSGKSPALFE